MRRGRQDGFSYIEILVGIVVLGLAAGGLVQAMGQSSLLIGRSKADSSANKIAAAELEQAHRIAYGDLGIVNGNPPGTIPASQTKTQGGQSFTVATQVDYVDDQALGQSQNYVNYKKVTVTVTPDAGTTKPVTQSTVIAPPSIGAIANKATAIVNVIDSVTGQPLQGVQVTIDKSTSPSRTAATGPNGQVVFAGLEPSAISPTDPKYEYRLSAALVGHVTHPTTDPTQMLQHLASKQTWNATIEMFRPATVRVHLRDSVTGDPVTEAATTSIKAGSPVQSESQFGTTGTFIFTQLLGKPIEPQPIGIGVQPDCYSPVDLPPAQMPSGYPGSTVEDVTVDLTPLPHGYIDVRVVDDSTGAIIPGARVQVQGGDTGLSPVIRTVDSSGLVHYCLSPTVSIKYVVSASVPDSASTVRYGTVSVLSSVLLNQTTSMELRLPRVSNTCDMRITFVNNGQPEAGRLVRLVGTGGIVYDQYQPTSGLSAELGQALFTDLAPGDYLAYYQNGFVNGDIAWSPTSGKSNRCRPGRNESLTLP